MNTKILKNLGEQLKYLRKEQGLTQEELAEKVGVHATYIGKIEGDELVENRGTTWYFCTYLMAGIQFLRNKKLLCPSVRRYLHAVFSASDPLDVGQSKYQKMA